MLAMQECHDVTAAKRLKFFQGTKAPEPTQVLITRKSRTATKQDKPMMRHNLKNDKKHITIITITS